MSSGELIQSVYTKQTNVSTIEIDESKDVRVTITSAEAVANIQELLQVLLALGWKTENCVMNSVASMTILGAIIYR